MIQEDTLNIQNKAVGKAKYANLMWGTSKTNTDNAGGQNR